jgi:hypothetical protein
VWGATVFEAPLRLVLPRGAARCGGPYGLLVDQRLKLLSDLEVERHDPLIELPLAAIGTFGREIKVFLRIAENINELGLD